MRKDYFITKEEVIKHIERNLGEIVLGEKTYFVNTVSFNENSLTLRTFHLDIDKRNNLWKIKFSISIELSKEEFKKLLDVSKLNSLFQ
jgi:hypothetical protein